MGNRTKKHTTFLMRPDSIQLLEDLKKELNAKVKVTVSKGEIVELLLSRTTANELAREIVR